MKKVLFIICCFIIQTTSYGQQQGHFRIKSNEFIQIGYDTYKSLTFGNSTGTPNNGNWGIEHWGGGLNFWRPWPTSNSINYAFFIKDNNGFIGIGKLPSHKLDVNGDIATYGTVRLYSDENLKKNIIKLNSNNCLNIIKAINSYSYNLKYNALPNQYKNTDSFTEVKNKTIEAEKNSQNQFNQQNETLRNGFMAQEVENVLPELVKTDKEGNKSIDYIGIIPVLLEAIKAQQEEIEQIKNKLKKLEHEKR